MGSLGAILKHPDDVYPLMKLKMAMRHAEKQIPPEPQWAFCYTMLHKVSRSFGLVIQQLGTDLRNAVCIFYLVLRALDTVEDDTSIATEIKVPILKAFHRHIYDRDWHFSCGTKEYKVLMDEFHHVSTAFLELGRNYQEAIEDITMRMGAGMAKFICKEVETIDDYDEYCHYVAGLVGLGLSKLFHASGTEDLASDSLSNSMGLFLQKTNIIRDYLEDINEIPKSRMFWPRQIWSKYVNKLEDLKNEENSVKAVQCLNDMVTNALIHMEDCLTYMAALRDPAIFRFCAIPQIMAIGTLALCYNNVEVFRGVVKMRRGLTAKVIERTKTMSDVYGAFFDFSCMLKSKVDKSDPNATKTLSRIDAVQKTCRESGTLTRRKSYIISKPRYNSALIFVLLIILAILFAYLSANRPANMWEPFINGQAVPYDPKYHQEWVRNKRHDRPRKVERPRNFDRRQNRDFQMNNHDVHSPSGSNLSGAPAYMPSPPNIAGPPPHNMGGQPNITRMPQNNMGGGMPQNNMGGGMGQNNMGGEPPQHMGGGQPQYNAGGGMPQNNMGGNPQYNMGRMPQNNMGGPPNNWGVVCHPTWEGKRAILLQYGPNNGGMPYQNREMPGPGQNGEYQPNNFIPNSGGGNPYQALDMPGRDMPPPPNY